MAETACIGGHSRAWYQLVAPAIVCLTLALAGCGAASPSQLLATSTHNLEHLRSYRVSGGLYLGQDRVVLSADVLSDGDATGSIDVEGVQSRFVVAHNVSYFSTLSPAITGSVDPSVEPMLAALHAPWWQAPGSTTARASLDGVMPHNLVSQFIDSRSGLVEASGRDGRGRAAIALTNGGSRVLVSTASAPQVLEVTTSPHYLSAHNLSGVDLVIDHLNEPLTVEPPAGARPLDNLDALPLYFTIKAGVPTACDAAGCTAGATVTAVLGHGTSTAQLSIVTSSQGTVATCSTPVSIAAVGQTATVSCRAASAAWTHFVHTGNPADTFGEQAVVNHDAAYGPGVVPA